MGYTWEQVMLNIDVRDEAKKEQRQQQGISDAQLAESEAQAGWGLTGTVLCGALWGPIGSFICKQIATYGVDALNKWEDMTVDPGKFDREGAEEFNKSIQKAASDQDTAQILNTATDLATMYVQAGGLQEGPTDFTTFGSGESEWSLFGKNRGLKPVFGESFTEAGPIAPGLSMDYGGKELYPVTFESDIPSLFSEWQKDAGILANIKPIGKKIASTNTGMSSLDTLFQSYIAGKEEKEA